VLCNFLVGSARRDGAAIDLSAAGLDDRQERWVAADACIAGRAACCFGIIDAETSFRAATRTWPD